MPIYRFFASLPIPFRAHESHRTLLKYLPKAVNKIALLAVKKLLNFILTRYKC